MSSPFSRGLHFCQKRRTSYTMDGFCLLYLLLILLMRSGDVETNPGPNTAVSTVSKTEFLKLAQHINPSYYQAVGISLGFSSAQLQAILDENLKNYTNALLDVFMKWNVVQQPPHSNKRQLLADRLREIDLGSLSDRLLNEPLFPASTVEPSRLSESQTKPPSAESRTKPLSPELVKQGATFFKPINSTVSEMEFLKLAKNIPSTYYDTVGISLGFSYTELQKILGENLNDYSKAFMVVFIKWNIKQQPLHSNIRQLLADKLRENDFGGLSDRLLNEPLIPNSTAAATTIPPMYVGSQAAAATFPSMHADAQATGVSMKPHDMSSMSEQDFRRVLKDIAKNMRTDEQTDNLGLELGIHQADINGYKIANRHGIDYEGTHDMLIKWSMNQKQTEVLRILRQALESEGVGRIDLCESLFP